MKSIKILSVMIVFSISILAGEWSLTGSLNQARSEHCAVLLDNDRVLVAGGSACGLPTNSCEIWNPATGEWIETDSMEHRRTTFAMVKLNNGNILAIGGFNQIEGVLKSCEIYNPETNQWSKVDSMNSQRGKHAAILLEDGKILVVSGLDQHWSQSCEIYNPETDTWNYTGFLNIGRMYPEIISLPNGNILAVGGQDETICEVYNPKTETWAYTGSMNYSRLCNHRITLLNNNKILVSGGYSAIETGGILGELSSSEIFNLITEIWEITDSLNIGRFNHASTILPNGKVLVNGGFPRSAKISTEIYNPETELWQTDTDMNLGRDNHTSTLLLDGRVLAVGSGGVMPQTELYSWNHQPSVIQFQCPENGFVGDTLNICVNVTDPDNDSVSVRFICCPGDTSEWSEFLPSESVFKKSHCYDSGGIYQLQVQVRDIWHCQGIHNSLSDWISGPEIHIRDMSLNQPPQVNQPQGPSQGFVNDTLTFNINITDPENDSVSVRFFWENEDTTDWFEYQESESQFEMTHCWADTGT